MTLLTQFAPSRGAATRPPNANRVAAGLFIFGLLDLSYNVAQFLLLLNLRDEISINLPLGFLALWAAAGLVWWDKRPIWPILTYGAAATLGMLIGVILATALSLPTKLILAFVRTEPLLSWLSLGYTLIAVAFLIWIFTEANTATNALRGDKPRLNPWLRPAACFFYPMLPCITLVVGILALLQGPWTKKTIDRARSQYGPDYDYLVTNYHVSSRNQQTSYQAIVLAYRDNEMKKIRLHWSD